MQLDAPGRETRNANMEREALPVAGNANGRCRMHGGSIQGQSECVQARRNTAEAIARRREISGVTRFARALEASELRLMANLEADGQAAYRRKFSDLAQTILAPKSRWRYSNQF
jgi:hypothetical protein